MVKCRGDLDQGLQEALFRAGESQPYGFPMLVSLEELPASIAAKPFCQRPVMPVQISVQSETRKAAEVRLSGFRLGSRS